MRRLLFICSLAMSGCASSNLTCKAVPNLTDIGKSEVECEISVTIDGKEQTVRRWLVVTREAGAPPESARCPDPQ